MQHLATTRSDLPIDTDDQSAGVRPPSVRRTFVRYVS
jgi:hypothetical protein